MEVVLTFLCKPLASSEQVSFSLVFFQKCVSGSRRTFNFVSIEFEIAPVLLNRKSSFNYLYSY